MGDSLTDDSDTAALALPDTEHRNTFALQRAKELRDLAEDWANEKQRAEAKLRDRSPHSHGNFCACDGL